MSGVRCDVVHSCGKLLKSEDEVQLHATRSGHANFSESLEEVKPLTEEERRVQLAKYCCSLSVYLVVCQHDMWRLHQATVDWVWMMVYGIWLFRCMSALSTSSCRQLVSGFEEWWLFGWVCKLCKSSEWNTLLKHSCAEWTPFVAAWSSQLLSLRDLVVISGVYIIEVVYVGYILLILCFLPVDVILCYARRSAVVNEVCTVVAADAVQGSGVDETEESRAGGEGEGRTAAAWEAATNPRQRADTRQTEVFATLCFNNSLMLIDAAHDRQSNGFLLTSRQIWSRPAAALCSFWALPCI